MHFIEREKLTLCSYENKKKKTNKQPGKLLYMLDDHVAFLAYSVVNDNNFKQNLSPLPYLRHSKTASNIPSKKYNML